MNLQNADGSAMPMPEKEKSTNEKVCEALKSAFVEYAIYPAGIGLVRDGWTCDGWKVVFKKYKTAETFDYFTGTGHRKVKKSELIYKPKGASVNSVAYKNWEKSAMVPVAPEIAGVLYSLILDSEALQTSFVLWCDEYGYDSDSIKARATYEACCSNAQKINSVIPREVQAALRDLLQDY